MALMVALYGVATLMVGSMASSMECGSSVSLCGVLTLQTGLGSGMYKHDEPCVHGLWPETGSYGSSSCIRPNSTSDPNVVYTCYAESGGDVVGFEIHEWEKHGECAGVANQGDYFSQICRMASDPISIMTRIRDGGGDVYAANDAIVAAGYEVFEVDEENAQLLLSACANPERIWTLAPVATFAEVCGGWSEGCVPGAHGPPCLTDEDCIHKSDCLRCASSGFCTTEPLVTL